MCKLIMVKMVFYPPCDIPVLKCKAENITQKLNVEYKLSNGWMARFMKYSGRVYREVCGESSSVIKKQQGLRRTHFFCI